MDTVWATVKVRRSMLAEASAMMPGMSNAAIVQRALESVLNTSASSGGGPSPEVIPGESGRGGGVGSPGGQDVRRRPGRDVAGASKVDPPSAPSRASSDGGAGGGAGRKDGVSHVPASPARKRSKVPAGPQASPPDDVSSSASQGREDEVGVNGGAGAAPDWDDHEAHLEAQREFREQVERQTTVEEMLASCPNCATTLEIGDIPARGLENVPYCPDCGYARGPS